jgi:hypothetical protein
MIALKQRTNKISRNKQYTLVSQLVIPSTYNYQKQFVKGKESLRVKITFKT